MSRSKIIIFIFTIALALFLVGCSADDLQNADMGRLQNAGLGNAGKKVVDEVVKTINGFTSEYEACFSWNPAPAVIEKTEDPSSFDGDARITESVGKVVSGILRALESSSPDEKIRRALLKPYSGGNDGGQAFKSVGDVVGGLVGDEIVEGIHSILELFNEDAGAGYARICGYSVPMPISSYDFLILLKKALTIVADNVELVLKLLDFDSLTAVDSDSKALSASYLKYIPDGIASNVGSRMYQTVGDKIAIAIIYDVFDALYEIFRGFNELLSDDVDAFTPGWIVKNTAEQFDRVISDFTVLGYIYGVHIEYAGLVGNLIK